VYVTSGKCDFKKAVNVIKSELTRFTKKLFYCQEVITSNRHYQAQILIMYSIDEMITQIHNWSNSCLSGMYKSSN